MERCYCCADPDCSCGNQGELCEYCEDLKLKRVKLVLELLRNGDFDYSDHNGEDVCLDGHIDDYKLEEILKKCGEIK